jgi:hypothetical protein
MSSDHYLKNLQRFSWWQQLWGVGWNLSVILNCFSLMDKDVECFFIYLLDICTSFENCLSHSSPHLLIGLFFSLVFNFCSSYIHQSAIQPEKSEIMSFVGKWMELNIIMLNEISQTNSTYSPFYVESNPVKKKKTQ